MNEGSDQKKDLGGRLADVAETALKVLTDPRGFYAALPREGGFEEPALFAAVLLVATGAIQALLSLLSLNPAGFFASLVLMPIFGAIGILIGAAIVLFASRALGGDATFESSARIVAYASAIMPIQAVLMIVPYLPLLASAYGLYIAIVAIIAVHRVAEDKAWRILGGVAALLLVISLLSTIAARRAASRLEDWGTKMEKSAAELEKASEQWRRQMEKATEQMQKGAEGSRGDD